MSTPPPYHLHQSLGYHLSIAARIQERRLDEQLKTLGLTRTSWCILLAVGNENLSQPSDIADFVGIDRTATSRALRQMEDAGLLARSLGTADKRTRRVVLTDKGETAIAKATPMARDNAEQMSALLASGDEKRLIELLTKLHENRETPLKTL